MASLRHRVGNQPLGNGEDSIKIRPSIFLLSNWRKKNCEVGRWLASLPGEYEYEGGGGIMHTNVSIIRDRRGENMSTRYNLNLVL